MVKLAEGVDFVVTRAFHATDEEYRDDGLLMRFSGDLLFGGMRRITMNANEIWEAEDNAMVIDSMTQRDPETQRRVFAVCWAPGNIENAEQEEWRSRVTKEIFAECEALIAHHKERKATTRPHQRSRVRPGNRRRQS